MKLVDKIVEVSRNPLSQKSRLIAKLLPVLVFFGFFPVLFFLVPKLFLDNWFHFTLFSSPLVRVIIGSMLIVLGVIFLLWTIKAQRDIGKGTPMPLMATQKLVIQKPYSFTRNPLAFGLINFYFGISVLIGSVTSGLMVFIFSAIILSYIKFVEEKELEQRYGEEYLEYKQITPFLIPRRNSN